MTLRQSIICGHQTYHLEHEFVLSNEVLFYIMIYVAKENTSVVGGWSVQECECSC